LREAIKEKRQGKLSAGVLLLHDNAPVHMSAKSEAAIQQCGFQQLNHPPYSPDLALSDYFLFRVMKKFLRVKRFSSDEEVKEAVTTWFEGQSKDFFSRGIKSLQQKWAKCIELLGDYIEKHKKIFVISCFFLTQVDKLLNALYTYINLHVK
jgi:histone-lysine N-methyltransferase SETMAR